MSQFETTDTLDTDDGPMRWTQITRVCVAYLRQPHRNDNALAVLDCASLLMTIAKMLDAAATDALDTPKEAPDVPA